MKTPIEFDNAGCAMGAKQKRKEIMKWVKPLWTYRLVNARLTILDWRE